MKACVVAKQYDNVSYYSLKALDAIKEGPIHYFDKNTLSIEEHNELMDEFVSLYPECSHWFLTIITDAMQPVDPVNFHIND